MSQRHQFAFLLMLIGFATYVSYHLTGEGWAV